MRQWFKGDTHLHTSVSDGKYSPEELIKKCKKKNLDFIILTDHNKNSAGEKSYFSDSMLVISGEEYSGSFGHFNAWGSFIHSQNGKRPQSKEEYITLAEKAKAKGCTVSLNHPFCSKCGWKLPLDTFPYDTLEVWNMFMHQSNMTAVDFWHSELLKGKRIVAVGGSDYHKDYGFSDMLSNPTIFVLAEELTESAVLSAVKKGNSFITDSPNASRLIISCGDCVQGDEVEFSENMTVHISAGNIKKGMTLQVFNNDKIVLEHTAEKNENFEDDIKISESGFVRAQIIYSLRGIHKLAFNFKMSLWRPKERNLDYPYAVYTLTNPLWVTF